MVGVDGRRVRDFRRFFCALESMRNTPIRQTASKTTTKRRIVFDDITNSPEPVMQPEAITMLFTEPRAAAGLDSAPTLPPARYLAFCIILPESEN